MTPRHGGLTYDHQRTKLIRRPALPPVRPFAALLFYAALPLGAAPARAQPSAPADGAPASPAPAPPVLARRAAERFPQPVLAGALIHREVLRPVEQQEVLGRVAEVVRRPDGALLIVVDAKAPGWRGWLGLGARPVAVPAEALALLGEYVALIDLQPAQLQALPAFDPAQAQPVPPAEMIRMGIVRPFH